MLAWRLRDRVPSPGVIEAFGHAAAAGSRSRAQARAAQLIWGATACLTTAIS